MNHGDPSAGMLEVHPSNLAWVEDMYRAWLAAPESVDVAWQATFAALDNSNNGHAPGHVTTENRAAYSNGNGSGSAAVALESARWPARTTLPPQKRVRKLVEDYRELGHLATDLDPLGLVDRSANRIRLGDYGIEDADLDTVINSEDIGGVAQDARLRDILAVLDETYCRHVGVEMGHISERGLRHWLVDRMESTRNRMVFSRAEQLDLLRKVIDAEVFEHFLQTKFIGAKRFSLEGGQSLIPLIERVIERSAAQGVQQIVIGMAHRGRLNVLAHVLGKPAPEIFAEFLDRPTDLVGDSGGDVKYHLGYSTDRATPGGKVHVSLAFNPSHLEIVGPVVLGRVRAKQDRMGDAARTRGLPLLIHGDAAFAGQGVVAESLNMSGLDAYTTGGSIHVVVNNQIGFTTSPRDAYCTTYPTDVARMLQVPILHVHGEDPEAVACAVDLAVDFRQTFHRDVVIDMWCYRKHGHNEADEPAYTQPVMYRAINDKLSIARAYIEVFAKRQNGETPAGQAEADRFAEEHKQALDLALEAAKAFTAPPRPSTLGGVWAKVRGGSEATVHQVSTAVSRADLARVGRALTAVPKDFVPHPKAKKLLEERAAMMAGTRPLDWGMGEALAFGTVVAEGVRVRMSGQDVRRGTFSHRHATIFDHRDGTEYTPLQHVADKQGVFEIRDSCLSEVGVLGFEYGYSLDRPEDLVIWEAQFGDFVNGAQVIIDQFLVSSEAKWRRVSGLVLLLPHGMEGQGPEHSNARPERFLNMGIDENIQVCNLTTPAQVFHVLRRQVLRPFRKPLIVRSPKSLLRHKLAVSSLDDLTKGEFQHVIPDRDMDPKGVERIVLCSGKIYYDLLAARQAAGLHNVALVRIEQMYPLRRDILMEALSVYQPGTPVIWMQEEARNMGAWYYMSREVGPYLVNGLSWAGVCRPLSPSPATGSSSRHDFEQARILEEALALPQGALVVSKGQIKTAEAPP